MSSETYKDYEKELAGRPRTRFYTRTLDKWVPERSTSTLVIAAGEVDAIVLRELGFTNVTLTNLSPSAPPNIGRYGWSRQDAENLDFPDSSFDLVLVHAGLHHCYSPHRGLLEMYRVARHHVIAFEPADNPCIHRLQRLGLAQDYEWATVLNHDGNCGGVANTCIPNLVYRWTAAEVRKTIQCYAPQYRHRFAFAYGTSEPGAKFIKERGVRRLAVSMLLPLFRLATAPVPQFRNLFAFKIDKPHHPQDLQPWLCQSGSEIVYNTGWQG